MSVVDQNGGLPHLWNLALACGAWALLMGGCQAGDPEPQNRGHLETVTARILDTTKSDSARRALAESHADSAVPLIRELTEGMQVGTPEEYERIPWIWRVAITAGQANRSQQIADMLDAFMPEPGKPLARWQCVVLGGGVVMGLREAGVWPRSRITSLIESDQRLKARWDRTIALASKMADNEEVPTPTRFDALFLIAMDLASYRDQLISYLESDVAQLQAGAIRGIGSVRSPEVANLLLSRLGQFGKENQVRAVSALLKTEERASALLDAVAKGVVPASIFTDRHRGILDTLGGQQLRARANELL